jgi:ubiquitin carboxyl-terminal hydrolase 4/11/15
MDPQFAGVAREDIWRLFAEMKHISAVQLEHNERLLRLERRQDDDARMRMAWNTSSPFPGVLSGTPQQGMSFPPPF